MITQIVPNDDANTLIQQSWENVFKVSNKVIHQSGVYGFDGIELIPNPNVHQMLASLSVISGMLTNIIGILGKTSLDTESVRLLLNSQTTIGILESVASALISGERDSYDKAIADLKRQANF